MHSDLEHIGRAEGIHSLAYNKQAEMRLDFIIIIISLSLLYFTIYLFLLGEGVGYIRNRLKLVTGVIVLLFSNDPSGFYRYQNNKAVLSSASC